LRGGGKYLRGGGKYLRGGGKYLRGGGKYLRGGGGILSLRAAAEPLSVPPPPPPHARPFPAEDVRAVSAATFDPANCITALVAAGNGNGGGGGSGGAQRA
jgi:hypothetical protein